MSALAELREMRPHGADNTDYRIRPACVMDAQVIARLHAKAAIGQPGAFLPKLGLRFLTQYYKLLICDQENVVLCAVDARDRIWGFISGTMCVEHHFTCLRRNRLLLLLSMDPRVLLLPDVLSGLWNRSRFVAERSEQYTYVVPSGCRIEYWAWDPDEPVRSFSVKLLLEFFERAKKYGIRLVRLEVDVPNRHVWVTHQLLGAKIVARFRTPDDRDRLILEHTLTRG